MKLFFVLNSTEHDISIAHEIAGEKIKVVLALKRSDAVFILLINVNMPTLVGILTFMSRINFMLIVGHPEPEKKYVGIFEYILASMLKVYLDVF